MRLSTISLLASFIYLAAADVQFTTPSPGGSVAGSGTISVAWEEGTGTTKISQLAGWTLTLFAGGETETAAQPVGTAVTGDHTSGTKTTTFTITPAAGPSGTNA
ncbi:hypothetical protein MMC10_004689 [Thelotrema lepadinum]|nr:hypothetical protein [Thelotrema lepadinum]